MSKGNTGAGMEICERGEKLSRKLSNRKRNKKPDYGWMQSEIDALQKYQNKRNERAEMTLQTYEHLREISMWVLHDKFGYGKKRLERVDVTIGKYLEQYEQGDLEANEIIYFASQKIGKDLDELVRSIPQNERMNLAGVTLPKNPRDMIPMLKSINGIMTTYFALMITALNTKMKMSVPQVKKFIDEVMYIINSLRRGFLKIGDMSKTLRIETGYEIKKGVE